MLDIRVELVKDYKRKEKNERISKISISIVANVCFLHDTSRLITIGTDDRTIMQWKFLSESDSGTLIDTRRLSITPTSLRAGVDEITNADLLDGTIENAQMLETAQQVGAYLDSDSEDSDSDLSGAEIDSDIEKEKQISYDRTLYREDYQVNMIFTIHI